MSSGDLVTRMYSDFLGVDFSNNHVSAYRSPDAVNIWKNYKELGKCISSRPGLKLFKQLNGKIYGLFLYKVATVQHMIIHCDTSLYDYNMQTDDLRVIKNNGMNPFKSQSFIYASILYIKDGLRYYKYDGSQVQEVAGYIPTTSISRTPDGGGKDYNEVNMLTAYRRNSFVGDGSSKDYYLNVESFDAGTVSVTVNGANVNNFTEHPALGYITFDEAPSIPDTDGEDNVVITFAKTVQGYRDRIDKCTLLEVFDNRVFFSGNPDYPNTVWYSSLNNPAYCSDLDYSEEGLDAVPITALVSGAGKLWVFKEPSQSNQSVFYHVPSIDSVAGKVYPSSHSNVSIGCVSTGVNFNDDICIFSDYGLEGITGNIDSEQVLSHRSSMIDSKILNEINYKKPILAEWQGYLLVFIDNHVYLADSRQVWNNINHIEYEWYYWELEKKVTATSVLGDELYICTEDGGIYTFDFDANVPSYWTTCEDFFENPVSQKVTNKKGCILNMEGEEIVVSTNCDNTGWEEVNEYENTKGYIVPKIKKKKWKTIRFKFSSNKKIKLYDFTVQCFVGGYVKR